VPEEAVARSLNDAGYRMVSKRHRDGYPFTKDTVTAMLQNRFYTGVVTLYGEEVRDAQGQPVGKHEPIISQDLFDRVQAVVAGKARRGRFGSTTGQAHVYVASSLARCSSCRENLRCPARLGRP
jgi:hypothetical protein